MNTVIGCIITLLIGGKHIDMMVSGNVKKKLGSYYVVDFSNAADFYGAKGDYSNVLIVEDRCEAKTYRSMYEKH